MLSCCLNIPWNPWEIWVMSFHGIIHCVWVCWCLIQHQLNSFTPFLDSFECNLVWEFIFNGASKEIHMPLLCDCDNFASWGKATKDSCHLWCSLWGSTWLVIDAYLLFLCGLKHRISWMISCKVCEALDFLFEETITWSAERLLFFIKRPQLLWWLAFLILKSTKLLP